MPASPIIVDLKYTPSSPTLSDVSSLSLTLYDDLGVLAAPVSPPSAKNCVQRRVKSSMRHKAYSVPSRGQREAFKKHSRSKKDMFVEKPFTPFDASGQPTLSPTFDSLLTQAVSVSTPRPRVAKKSGLTIKIPSLVDRLALRLVHSCNVEEQAEEEDLNDSPDGYTASESSLDGDQVHIQRPSSPSSSPDRLSRRELRRRAVAPYYRTGKSKRKELWLNSEVVPTILLPSCSPERHTRNLRSGRRN